MFYAYAEKIRTIFGVFHLLALTLHIEPKKTIQTP